MYDVDVAVIGVTRYLIALPSPQRYVLPNSPTFYLCAGGTAYPRRLLPVTRVTLIPTDDVLVDCPVAYGSHTPVWFTFVVVPVTFTRTFYHTLPLLRHTLRRGSPVPFCTFTTPHRYVRFAVVCWFQFTGVGLLTHSGSH